VDVDVPLAGQQLPSLLVGERGAAAERANEAVAAEIDLHAGPVGLAGGAMEMGGGRRTRESGPVDVPGDRARLLVEPHGGGGRSRALDRRDLRHAVQVGRQADALGMGGRGAGDQQDGGEGGGEFAGHEVSSFGRDARRAVSNEMNSDGGSSFPVVAIIAQKIRYDWPYSPSTISEMRVRRYL